MNQRNQAVPFRSFATANRNEQKQNVFATRAQKVDNLLLR